MDRRTAIRTLATATVLPVLAPSDAAALLEARRTLGATGVRQGVLETRELDAIAAIADIILPRTQTPGATDVGVHGFVDLIVSEWMDADEADAFRAGLAQLDQTAEERYGRVFTECDGEQQVALVRELDDQLPAPGSGDAMPEGFYPTLKRLVVTGYFTTQTGARGRGYRTVPGTFRGCVAPGDAP